jgi:O-antigen ligase
MVIMSPTLFDKNSIFSWLLFTGWFLLPVAFYGNSEIIRTNIDGYFWVMGVGLPFYFIVTKASATSILALIWSMCALKIDSLRKQMHWLDLCLLIFILSPFLSMYKGNTTLIDSLESVLYLLVVWGVPYFVGKIFITSHAKLSKSAEVFVIISLIGSPFFLIEFFMSPIFYEYVFGFHPFNNDGEVRYFNFRPMLLLEHGNQLGMWYSTAALVAFGFWRFSNKQKIFFIKVNYVHHYSVFILLLSQSRGAIILYGIGVSLILLLRCIRKKIFIIYFMLALLAITVIPLVFAKQIYGFAKHTLAGQQTVQVIKDLGGGSLTWRIGKDLKNAQILKENFFTGLGTVNWSKDNVRSWGAILLILGGYGIVGLVSWSLLMLYPLFLTIKQLNLHRKKDENEMEYSWFVLIIAFALVTNWVDAFLNSFFIVSLLIWSGGLVNISKNKLNYNT